MVRSFDLKRSILRKCLLASPRQTIDVVDASILDRDPLRGEGG